MCVVADRGFVSEVTLEALSKMDPPVRYVIGVRMRRSKEVAEVVLKSRKDWKTVTPERVDRSAESQGGRGGGAALRGLSQ